MSTILTRRIERSSSLESSTDTGRLLPAAVFVLALAVNLCGIGWGLPNGNETWANDAIQPGAPLSILHRLFVSDPLNSGWFWFKYPLGHVLILGLVYAPYLGWLFLTGGLSHPSSDYPHGFADPESALATLALLGRGVSALMGAGCTLIAYLCVLQSFGRRAAAAAAVAVGFCYPLVFYAHTTNVEVPYLFWMLLAFLAGVRLVEGRTERRWWVILGAGAAMSVSSKELGAGFFVAIPPVVLAANLARHRPWRDLLSGGLTAGLTTLVVMVLANDVFLNPLGFARRIGFLTHALDPAVALQYAPYYFPIDLGSGRGLQGELEQLTNAGVRILSSLSTPTAVLAIVGVIVAARRCAWWAVLAVACCATAYLFGVRAMLSLSMRYVLPITVVAAMTSGIAVDALFAARRLQTLAATLAAAALLWMTVYGAEVNRMLVHDARYAAESWLTTHVADGDVIEVYQRPTYLPRFPARARVAAVPFDQRTIEGIAARRPQWIVLSSAGLSGVSVAYRTDWKGEAEDSEDWDPSQIAPGGVVMNYKDRDNVEMLDALVDERLGYRRAAHFALEPWIDRTLIQSLNPEITIFARVDSQNGDTSTHTSRDEASSGAGVASSGPGH